MASTSGFGQTGPYAGRPAYDIVVQAMGGIMSLTGHPGGPPTRVGTSTGDITAGLFTAIGIRRRCSIASAAAGDAASTWRCSTARSRPSRTPSRATATGEAPGPLGSRHPSIAPFEAFATRDGHVIIAAGNDALFDELCRSIGRPELVA